MSETPVDGGTVVEVHHKGFIGRKTGIGLISALCVFAIIIVWGGFKLIDITDRLGTAQRQIKDTQTTNHASRLRDQARTDKEIAQLACILISQTNENDPKAKLTPKQRAVVRQFRKYYGCPPYSKHNAENPLQGVPPISSSAQPRQGQQPAPASHPSPGPSSSQRPVAGSKPPVRVTVTPSPSRVTVTSKPTTQPAPPGLLPLPHCTIQVGDLRVC